MNWEIVSRVIQIFGVLIPVIGWFVVHKLSISRENKASSKDTIKIKRKYFKKLKNTDKYSWYERELFAKKIAENTNATLSEVLFFLQFKDADQWMSSYFRYKRYIETTESSENIINFKSKYTRLGYWGYILTYGLLLSCSLIPLLWWGDYSNEVVKAFHNGPVIIGIWLIIFPFIFFTGGLISLNFAENMNISHKFLEKFQKIAIKIDLED